LLYDLTSTLNVGAELRLGEQFTLDVPFSYNPWKFSGNRYIKHWLVQPELRYWTKRAFSGHFLGAHAHYAQFNFSRIFSEYKYEGWLAGAGLSYGYRWALSPAWGLEASLGLGYAYIDYDQYQAAKTGCNHCGSKLKAGSRHYLGVTKAAVSLVYNFGRKPRKSPVAARVIDIMPPLPPRVDTLRVVEQVVHTDTVYVAPAPTPVYRQERGEAYILFAVDRHELRPEVGNNRTELAKIEHSMRTVQQHPRSQIRRIHIEAFASPEGDTEHNLRLSAGRAEALKAYMIATYRLAPGLFTTCSAGENWQGLQDAIAVSRHFDEPQKDELQRILSIASVSERKARLKAHRGGQTYALLLREIYPGLRLSAYRIDYTVASDE
jgi:outer membrane protein OmpA-like peptidoglycan-associated protein